ncbi:hypothetical protein H2198_007406 [Neophaeococcomyces mojaviensis]|uniref:Uncharacterized protein n=1 Tax=Neophaeococcomyces mojaviensis TaxID=3383035 RepID=A0ACC3A036_9EURO|nr:hypothetical protein H2198_007406 [Knufia sp. JES_112]
MASDSLIAEIRNLEEQTWKALSNDGKALLPFLSEDCIFLFPLGMKLSGNTDPNIKEVMSSDAFIPWKSYQMTDVAVTPIGNEGAVISYRVKAKREKAVEHDHSFRALVSSTWRKDSVNGAWQLCVHQQTPFEMEIEDLARVDD